MSKQASNWAAAGPNRQAGGGLKIAAGIAVSLLGWGGLILYFARSGVLTPAEAGLMFIAVIGMYVGFGTLIGVYRFINKLE